MSCIKIGNAIVCCSPGDFNCPYCNHLHTDENEYYLKKMDKSEDCIAKIKCKKCRKLFAITYDYTGKVHGFKITKSEE